MPHVIRFSPTYLYIRGFGYTNGHDSDYSKLYTGYWVIKKFEFEDILDQESRTIKNLNLIGAIYAVDIKVPSNIKSNMKRRTSCLVKFSTKYVLTKLTEEAFNRAFAIKRLFRLVVKQK